MGLEPCGVSACGYHTISGDGADHDCAADAEEDGYENDSGIWSRYKWIVEPVNRVNLKKTKGMMKKKQKKIGFLGGHDLWRWVGRVLFWWRRCAGWSQAYPGSVCKNVCETGVMEISGQVK